MKALLFKGLLLAVFFLWGLNSIAQVNSTNRQVVLQGFWWDYWNANYPNGWSNYLAELAPRLKDLGIDAVWIPPTIKNTGTNSVGYAPFDHYDLGDKYQKNGVKTRMGDKDELLRMVAVLKANGIEVIQDIVLNHITGAGSASGGGGGQDVSALDDGSTNKYKNFRYSCFATSAINETATNYLGRAGRFSKNWQNFYPNNSNVCCTNDINSPFWGPDISYESNAFGLSGNASYNPSQSTDYMRSGMRNWLIWYKKQVGWDGVRIDAVKHFPSYATEDFLWNLQNNALWANGTNNMFAVGEYVGNMTELDNWANAVQNRAGTFDFSLRFALQDVITQNGNYNLGSVPSAQQTNRQRTVPFVNNHDTYRPTLNTVGNITGWNAGSQIGTQIEVVDPRASIVHAIALAVDGAPEIFFEDLFNIGYNANRFNHQPSDTVALTTHSDIENLLWCHQNLHFKEGAYLIRLQAQDALVMERSGKALIAVNDHFTIWQNVTAMQTSFADGTILKDYSGAHGNAQITVSNGGKVDFNIPPCDGTAPEGRKGYCIWAPIGQSTNYNRPAQYTTQEWEMDDDLGDSGVASLQQGGKLPTNSRTCRVVGRVFCDTASTVTINLYPTQATLPITLELLDANCEIIDTISAAGNLIFTYSVTQVGWYTVRIRNTSDNQAGQKCWVKMNYRAPQTVNTAVTKNKCACSQGSGAEIWEEGLKQWEIFPNPMDEWLQIENLSHVPQQIDYKWFDGSGKLIFTNSLMTEGDLTLDVSSFQAGIYFLEVSNDEGSQRFKLVKP